MATAQQSRSAAPAWDPIHYELRIGVTGHRDLERPDAVETAVRSLLQYVVKVLEGASEDPMGPHGSPQSVVNRIDRVLAHCLSLCTRASGGLLPRVSVPPRWPAEHQRTPLKLTIVTSLARGADQIVARVVCDMVDEKRHERERWVEAILPFEVQLYEQEFTAKELPDFHAFLDLDRGKRCTHPEPTITRHGLNPSAADYAAARDEAFAAAGQRMVDTSEIIIAIWDPAHGERPGITAATVRYALNAGRLVLWLNPADLWAGPGVLRSAEPNKAVPPALRTAPAGCRVEEVPSSAKHLSRDFHRLAAFNRDAAVKADRLRAHLDTQRATLRELAAQSGLPTDAAKTLTELLLPIVLRADHLAIQYRELRQFSARLWPFAAALVVTLMAIQIIFADHLYWLAFVELAVLVLGSVSYRVSLSDDWHGKWLNDRRLAEGLRSAMYAALVRSSSAASNPLPFYDPGNAWFIASVKRIIAKERRQFASNLPLAVPAVRTAIVSFLKNAWVVPQGTYHGDQAKKLEHKAAFWKSLRLTMIAALAAVAAAHGFGFGHGQHEGVAWDRVDLWIGAATVALPAWAAAFHVASSLDDHQRLAERSAQMASLLAGLARQLDDADTVDELVQRVDEAERIMDLESAEWAESLVDRRPEFTG